MSSEITFATITDDHGIASELVPVSPIFTRCGPCTRGRYADRREARTWRTDARQALHHGAIAEGNARSGVLTADDDSVAADGFRDFRGGRS
jgi:hypothetical protein